MQVINLLFLKAKSTDQAPADRLLSCFVAALCWPDHISSSATAVLPMLRILSYLHCRMIRKVRPEKTPDLKCPERSRSQSTWKSTAKHPVRDMFRDTKCLLLSYILRVSHTFTGHSPSLAGFGCSMRVLVDD